MKLEDFKTHKSNMEMFIAEKVRERVDIFQQDTGCEVESVQVSLQTTGTIGSIKMTLIGVDVDTVVKF